jgi:hypothetical protein
MIEKTFASANLEWISHNLIARVQGAHAHVLTMIRQPKAARNTQ